MTRSGWPLTQHSAGLDAAALSDVGGHDTLTSGRQLQISSTAPHQRGLSTDALAGEEIPGAVAPRQGVRTERPAQHRLSVRPRGLKDAADLFHLRKLAACVMKVTVHQHLLATMLSIAVLTRRHSYGATKISMLFM